MCTNLIENLLDINPVTLRLLTGCDELLKLVLLHFHLHYWPRCNDQMVV